MERPLGHIRAWRKTFDLLIEAESFEDAQRIAHEEVGQELGSPSGSIFYEEIHEVEGGHEGVIDHINPDRYRYYPSRATMVASASTLGRAVEAFNSLLGSVTTSVEGWEISFEATDDNPPREGTMLAPWARKPR